MNKNNPILHFRILGDTEIKLLETNDKAGGEIKTEGHTMVTKSREAIDSSEHSDTSI